MIGDNIYVFGGSTLISGGWFSNSLNTTMIYNVSTGVTTYGANMPNGVVAQSCVKAANGSIRVIGGYNHSSASYLRIVQIYNPATNSWSKNANLAPVTLCLSAAVLGTDGRVYIFGGGWTENTMIIYNPAADSWAYGADVPYRTWGSSAVTYSSTEILPIGGANVILGDVTDEVAVYNPVADSWRFVSSMNIAKGYSHAVLARNGCSP